jgi:hypothetical protein
MKRLIILVLLFFGVTQYNVSAQNGGTFNVGLGLVVHIDYEFNAGRSFTLAPFANFYTYSNRYNWNGDYYTYRETVIPIGVKGTFYFDELFHASSEWDFYAAGSLGFAIISRNWQNGYGGDTDYYRGGNALFLDAHIGAEYHFNSHTGIFLDLSSGVSTIGLAFH